MKFIALNSGTIKLVGDTAYSENSQWSNNLPKGIRS